MPRGALVHPGHVQDMRKPARHFAVQSSGAPQAEFKLLP